MPRKRTRGVRRNEQRWTKIRRRFHASGLGSREFCRRDGVPLSSLQRSVPATKFVEIVSPASVPTTTATPTRSLEVSFANGALLRFQA